MTEAARENRKPDLQPMNGAKGAAFRLEAVSCSGRVRIAPVCGLPAWRFTILNLEDWPRNECGSPEGRSHILNERESVQLLLPGKLQP